MNTKNIFKAVALAMLMPTMLLTTACSSEDDALNNTANTENTINKGYALPVTVNVTRQGDATTRATFDGSKLNFSDGDKLFVEGGSSSAGSFAGTLTWQSGGTFSGTIYTYHEWTGTADALFTAASAEAFVNATLLPAGYGSYGYLSIYNNTYTYDDIVKTNKTYTCATSKADGVAQFSYEKATTYSSGFALAPQNAILNFTITGLAASTNVAVSLTGSGYTITKTVTTDGSGNATFSAGVEANTDLNYFSLTVGGTPITLVSSEKTLTAGKIYNITRSKVTDLSSLTGNYTALNGETLTGTLTGNYKISIADGATVTLAGVTINGTNDGSYIWAGITCEGDATIILSGTNTVNGFYEDYPGVFVPSGSTLSTLTIQGTGVLNASSNGYGAGIGGGNQINCGNIVIKSGTINATGGEGAAGIGSSDTGECGDITINGGIVTATGGEYADGIGIGRGMSGKCGNITINGGSVTARGGSKGAGIGGWSNGSSRTTITITGGNVVATGGEKAAGIGSGDDLCCNINISGGAGTATKGAGAECSIGRAFFVTDYDDPYTHPCGTISISGIVGVGVSTYQHECTSETCTWQNSNP